MRLREAAVRTATAAAVLAALVAPGSTAGAAAADQATPAGTGAPRVSVVGDSTLAGFSADPASLAPLTSAYDVLFDAKECRRTVAPSCSTRGVTPPTGLDVLRANAGRLGPLVVLGLGSNDDPAQAPAAVAAVLAEARVQGVRRVVWLTLHDPTGRFATTNRALRAAAAADPLLRLADWNAHAAGRSSWFATDQVHLTNAGRTAMAAFLRTTVDAAAADLGLRGVVPARCIGPTAGEVPGSGPASPPPASAAAFSALTPVRLLDTRLAGLPVGAGRTVSLTVAGTAGVPPDATAVGVTVTATEACGAGYVTAHPCGGAPPLASTVNLLAGATVANLAIVGLDAGGRLCLTASVVTDVVVDVAGWFGPSARARLVPVLPRRIADSRLGVGVPRRLAAGSVAEIAVPDLTPGATGVVVSVTAVAPAAPGFLTAWPCDQPRPLASNVNHGTGGASANLALVGVAPSGRMCVATSAATDLVVDLAGVLAGAGAAFRPTSPTRLVDTRTDPAGPLPADGERAVPVPGAGPGSAAAVNLTVTNPRGDGFVAAYPCGAGRPLVSNVNFAAGATVAAQAVVPLGPGGRICVTASVVTDLVVDLTGTFDGAPAG